MLCAVIILLVGCMAVPNSKVESTSPPPVVFSKTLPPTPPMVKTFALSSTFEATEPLPDYVSPVHADAPSFGTVTLIGDHAMIEWLNWRTNSAYRIEVSGDLVTWIELSRGVSGDSDDGILPIRIMDFSVDDPLILFYRLVPQ